VDSILSYEQSPLGRAPACGRAPSGEAAGLVPSKTSLQTCVVNLSPNCKAERRIKKLKRSVWASGHLHALAENGFRPSVCWFVTLTYKGIEDWRPDHISKATQRFHNWCAAKGHPCRYTWVAELQGRGAVHYHLLAWLPHGVRMPHWDRPSTKRRAAFWPHGMTETEKARSGVGYLMKYLSKLGEFHRFPKGLRLYGIAGLTLECRAVRGWFNLPEWAKRSFGVGELVRRMGRLVVRATGEILEPAFKVAIIPSGLLITQLRELPARFHDGAYSTWPAQ
jgi:hypothetical protein